MTRTFIQSDDFTIVFSEITGNKMIRNNSIDSFLLGPDFDVRKAARLCNELTQACAQSESGKRIRASRFHVALEALSSATQTEGFIAAFNDLVSMIVDAKDSDREYITRIGLRTRFFQLTHTLWQEDLLAAPSHSPFGRRASITMEKLVVFPRMEWIREIKAASEMSYDVARSGAALRIWRVAMTCIGVKEIGDLTPTTVQQEALEYTTGNSAGAIRPLLKIQKRIYGGKAIFTEHDWNLGRGRTKRMLDFSDFVARDPTLEQWQQLMISWLSNAVTGGLGSKRDGLTVFIRYLEENPTVTRNPLEYVSRQHHISVRLEDWLETRGLDISTTAQRLSRIAVFFDWYVDVKLCMEDDHGRPVRSPELYNPIVRRKELKQRSETAREALPTKYINELIHLITDNDFEWPKQSSEDHVKHYDTASNSWIKVWSPVRSHAILMKLYLPLRTYQVTMLDSGEADAEIYQDKRWIANTGPAASRGTRNFQNGVLRRFLDRTLGSDFVGFYVNTNKTADRFKDGKDRGYEIPWQHDEVISLVQRMIKWQATYNPIFEPTRWSDLTNPIYIRNFTEAQLKARGSTCFLFRDPNKSRKDQPITASRLAHFWRKLLDELERRVAARGEVLPNGQPIRFIDSRGKDGRPMVPSFDLHSLRVSILTALSVEGGVPLAILSKCVAGHATILMTLYYLKPGASYISQKLAEAQERILSREKENYLRFLQDCNLKQAESVVASNNQIGLHALQKNSPTAWLVGDLGICPVGGSMCDSGGPKVSGENNRNDYQTTPGGPRNCIRCRFFISGPAFLGGLVAHFNSIGIEIMDAGTRLRQMETGIIELENKMAEHSEVDRNESRKLDVLYGRREAALTELDDVSHNWHATYSMIERAKALITAEPLAEHIGSAVRLLAGGDITDISTALEKATEFELFNNVCQHATVYPAPTVPYATLRRGRLLDAMLARNERHPVFATLTDDQALAVGNEFVNFLYARLGSVDSQRVLDGSRMLQATGMLDEIDTMLKQQIGNPVKMASLVKKQTPGLGFVESTQ